LITILSVCKFTTKSLKTHKKIQNFLSQFSKPRQGKTYSWHHCTRHNYTGNTAPQLVGNTTPDTTRQH